MILEWTKQMESHILKRFTVHRHLIYTAYILIDIGPKGREIPNKTTLNEDIYVKLVNINTFMVIDEEGAPVVNRL